jgi:hypothetical protein
VSFEITTAFTQQYGANMLQRAQQKGSRLRNAVTVETGVGSDYYFDYVGTVEAQTINTRHGDSPLNSTPTSRRRVDLVGRDTGDLIDKIDKVQMLADPTSPFIMAHGSAMGRAMDDVIIGNALATAKAGVDGSLAVPFPASNVVGVNSWKYGTGSGNAGLTISKLIEARSILVAAEGIEDGEMLYFGCAQKQIANLLSTTEATSGDYAEVKALVRGEINTYMGFEFIRTERFQTDANGYRRNIAWSKSGLGLAIGADITSEVAPRPDKRFSWYAYFMMFIGSTRLEEEKVVEVKCLEV